MGTLGDTLRAITIPISYKIRIGNVKIIWLITSGGVITAEIIRIMIIANRLYFFMVSAVSSPILDKK
jgi:hypothetical protein